MTSSTIRLYAFLGNYGSEFSKNRHNVAWQFLETLPFYGELTWTRKFKGLYASRDINGERIFFLKPETYMNNSGESIVELVRFFRIEPQDVMAIHDELEMPFGSFGFKFSGGLGGHNGLRSMEKHLGTRDFARLRFGIGRPEHPDVAGYVLSDFTPAEQEILQTAVFPQAGQAFMECLEQGFDTVVDKYKKKICI